MKKIPHHIYSKFTAIIILAGFILSILFGQGTHVHSVFDHLFEHGDVHAYVHVHNHPPGHEHQESGFDLEDSHSHPISNLTLKSVRAPFNMWKMFDQTHSCITVIPAEVQIITERLIPTSIDLPPPKSASTQLLSSSLLLRAPPTG